MNIIITLASQGGDKINWTHYIDYNFGINFSYANSYTAPADGVFAVITDTAGTKFQVFINGVTVYNQYSGLETEITTVYFPVCTGDVISFLTKWNDDFGGYFSQPCMRFYYKK